MKVYPDACSGVLKGPELTFVFIVPGWACPNLHVINHHTSVFHSNQNVTNTSFCLLITDFSWIHNRLKKKFCCVWLKFEIIWVKFLNITSKFQLMLFSKNNDYDRKRDFALWAHYLIRNNTTPLSQQFPLHLLNCQRYSARRGVFLFFPVMVLS